MLVLQLAVKDTKDPPHPHHRASLLLLHLLPATLVPAGRRRCSTDFPVVGVEW